MIITVSRIYVNSTYKISHANWLYSLEFWLKKLQNWILSARVAKLDENSNKVKKMC